MTRQQLNELKSIKKEIESITRELKEISTMSDAVKGSSTEFPWISHTISIEGMDFGKWNRLRAKLKFKLEEFQDILLESETWIESLPAELREIARLKWRNGLTHEKIADELGISERTVNRKLENLYEMLNVIECHD